MEQRKKLLNDLPYKVLKFEELKMKLAAAGLDTNEVLKISSENESKWNINLCINSIEWLKFYDSMRGSHFPIEINEIEIKFIDTHFIRATRE